MRPIVEANAAARISLGKLAHLIACWARRWQTCGVGEGRDLTVPSRAWRHGGNRSHRYKLAMSSIDLASSPFGLGPLSFGRKPL